MDYTRVYGEVCEIVEPYIDLESYDLYIDKIKFSASSMNVEWSARNGDKVSTHGNIEFDFFSEHLFTHSKFEINYTYLEEL